MMDILFQAVLSNTGVALILAFAAVAVGLKGKYPQLTNLLWLLVLVKLVTPPLFTLPTDMLKVSEIRETTSLVVYQTDDIVVPSHTDKVFAVPLSITPDIVEPVPPAAVSSFEFWPMAKFWLGILWLAGSVLVAIWSLRRIVRFNQYLMINSVPAPKELEETVATFAKRLELNHTPAIYISSARLSPMVWWVGGKVRIIMPQTLIESMEPGECQWIIAHELAHVKRRDYLVRWLEWFTCVGFWWNPLVWWAQKGLRESEEICCDSLILEQLSPKPHTYATSLLTAVEFLSVASHRPPVMASAINHGGSLERRFNTILSARAFRTTPYWMRLIAFCCAAVLLPLGVVNGQNPVEEYDTVIIDAPEVEIARDEHAHEHKDNEWPGDNKAIEHRVHEAVKAGALTEHDAALLLGALHTQRAEHQHDVVIKHHPEPPAPPAPPSTYLHPPTPPHPPVHRVHPHIEKSIRATIEQGKRSVKRAEKQLATIRLELAGINADEVIQEAFETIQEVQAEVTDELRDIRIELTEEIAEIDIKAIVKDALEDAAEAKKDAQRQIVIVRKELTNEMRSFQEEELYPSLEEIIQEAVEAGKLSSEEAEEKLSKLRKLFSS